MIFSSQLIAESLDKFSSDGCSHFPEGTLTDKTLWCNCCITHDIAYWQGGSQQQKKQADQALYNCVLQKTANKILAKTMYYGVRLGGSPWFPMSYRWGYGWEYGHGFRELNQYEKKQVKEKLTNYPKIHALLNCNFEYLKK